MNKLKTALLFSLTLTLNLAADTDERPEKPNVILILTDDLGWQDVACYDIDTKSPIETPNIDSLAKKGVMFWQGYSPAPTCAPTRCAIMSGLHPARTQKTHVVGGAPPTPFNIKRSSMIEPWYSGRMPISTYTIAEALKDSGYTTCHVGKWHMAINHNAYPHAKDQGFDYSFSNIGTTKKPFPNRLSEFATDAADDPFRLDENGFVKHQNSEDALLFLKQQNSNPFFLYYATWLVHTPIHTRNKRLLEKYCKKLGLEFPTPETAFTTEGQKNPYYCSMVEALDYYIGQVITYLEQTEDPRWKGHKLIENTYIIFTSDNGGMERIPGEQITDNYPLDRGKISIMEGGVRVPLIITGPDIKPGVQSDVMVNGLDFYPTILNWTKIKNSNKVKFDGVDIAPLLSSDATDASLVKEDDGSIRDTMIWHFPNSVALESSIRIKGYKLVKNYNYQFERKKEQLELFQLYSYDKNGKATRVDIEESKNIAKVNPKLTASMHLELLDKLKEMKASYPYLNPHYKRGNKGRDKQVPSVIGHEIINDTITVTFKNNGAKMTKANLIFTDNGKHRYEEWYRKPAQVHNDNTVTATIPEGATHIFINLIDENNYLVSYPEITSSVSTHKKQFYSTYSIPVNKKK